MATGWTWEYIDEFVTIPRLLEMSEYWKRFPPLHQILSSYFSIAEKAEKAEQKIGTAEDLMREFGVLGGAVLMGRVDRDLEPT